MHAADKSAPLLPSTIQIDLPRPAALPSRLRAHAIEYNDRPTLNYPRAVLPLTSLGGLREISMRLRRGFPQLGVRVGLARLAERPTKQRLQLQAGERAQAILLALAVATVGGGAVSALHVEAGAAGPPARPPPLPASVFLSAAS